MRRLSPGVSRRPVSLAVFAWVLASACSADPPRFMQIAVRAPLTSATSTVVLARVTAEQGGITTSADIDGAGDSATLSLRVGELAVVTGTVFTFEAARWRSFSSTQSITPDVGDTMLELTLVQAASRIGTAVPTVTVHGAPQDVLGEQLPITITDTATGFTALTPFVTGDTIDLPAGRDVLLSVPDRFSGAQATRQLDTTTFTIGTQIQLAFDATIDVTNLDVDALAASFAVLAGNGLGLECAVDAGCSATSFAACTADGVKLATERSYTVAVRYAEVPGSCSETRITRDLTPPTLSVNTSPLFVQAGLASLTLVVDANEPIDPATVVVTAGGGTTNLCTATAESPSRVSCAVSLAGLDLTTAVVFRLDVSDVGGQRALRTITVPVRNPSLPVQVVGLRTVAEQPALRDFSMLTGITVAAFDGQPLCGIGPQPLTLALDPATTFQTSSIATWYGPSSVPAKAVGTPNVVTYWASLSVGFAKTGSYHVTGAVVIPACGSRGSSSAPIDADVVVADRPARWLTPGPLVVSPLPTVGIASPLVLADYGYDGLESSDPSVVDASGGEGFYVAALKPGKARLSTLPTPDRAPEASVPASIDVEVVAPPEILAVQVGSSRVDLQACKLEYSIVSPK